MALSSIEWTDFTWNPVTGCTPISAGCQNCYAKRMATRLKGIASQQRKYRHGFRVTCHPKDLKLPYGLKHGRNVFVVSMGDLFHDKVPDDFIGRVFRVMNETPRHVYQVLTKRADRLAALGNRLNWTDNIYCGVSVETPEYWNRVGSLRRTGARTKFLSMEPLLGPFPKLDLDGIDWVIVGGESGPGARPMHIDWVRAVRDRCVEQGVPFFFKQWGRHDFNPDPSDPTDKKNGGKSKGGKLLDGLEWNQYPPILNSTRLKERQMPKVEADIDNPAAKPTRKTSKKKASKKTSKSVRKKAAKKTKGNQGNRYDDKEKKSFLKKYHARMVAGDSKSAAAKVVKIPQQTLDRWDANVKGSSAKKPDKKKPRKQAKKALRKVSRKTKVSGSFTITIEGPGTKTLQLIDAGSFSETKTTVKTVKLVFASE